MSIIGHYVHLTAAGYNRFGTKYNSWDPEGSETFDFSVAQVNLMKAMQNRKSKLTQKDKEMLERGVGNIISGDKRENNSEENKLISQIQNKLVEALNKEFEPALGKINWDTGNISGSGTTQLKKNIESSLTPISVANSHKVSTIEERIQSLLTILPTISNAKTKKELTNKIQKIQKELESIGRQVNEDGEVSWKIKNISAEESAGVVKQLNEALRIARNKIPIALQKGTFFEYIIALAPLAARANANDAIEEALLDKALSPSTVVGGKATSVEISFDNFTKDINWSAMNLPAYSLNESGTALVSGLASQEKIDVILQLDDDRSVGISAKNVNLKSGYDIHIVSGTSLLYLLQNEDANFVNHYLNLVAEHNDPWDTETIDTTSLAAAHQAIKASILAKALSGETYGRQGADIFMINDNSSVSGVRIYDIPRLIEKAANNLERFVEITANNAPIDTISFANSRAATYSDRITALLQDVHRYKISASLKPSLLDSLET